MLLSSKKGEKIGIKVSDYVSFEKLICYLYSGAFSSKMSLCTFEGLIKVVKELGIEFLEQLFQRLYESARMKIHHKISHDLG